MVRLHTESSAPRRWPASFRGSCEPTGMMRVTQSQFGVRSSNPWPQTLGSAGSIYSGCGEGENQEEITELRKLGISRMFCLHTG